MIVNFYRKIGTLPGDMIVTTKNIEEVPKKGTKVIFSNQTYYVGHVEFIIDTCAYNVYLIRK